MDNLLSLIYILCNYQQLDTVNTLETVAELAVNAQSFLANMHLHVDQQIIECLESFVGCLELIHWIKEETEGWIRNVTHV